jgi:hypothetical protein
MLECLSPGKPRRPSLIFDNKAGAYHLKDASLLNRLKAITWKDQGG